MMIHYSLDAAKLQKVATVLKTIAHPIRLEILTVLGSTEAMSVKDISSAIKLEVEQSLLSHHLVKLKDRGILISQKEGKYIKYSIKDKAVLSIFDCMEKCDL